MSPVFETEWGYENDTLASFWLAGISLNMHIFLKHVPYLTRKVNSYDCYHNRMFYGLWNGSSRKLADIIKPLFDAKSMVRFYPTRKNIHFTILVAEHIVWFFCHRTCCLVMLERPTNPLPPRGNLHFPLHWYAPLSRFLNVLPLPLDFLISIVGSHHFLLLECLCLPSLLWHLAHGSGSVDLPPPWSVCSV